MTSKLYNMTFLNSVLLPNSDAQYFIWVINANGTSPLEFLAVASNSVFMKSVLALVGIAVGVISLF